MAANEGKLDRDRLVKKEEKIADDIPKKTVEKVTTTKVKRQKKSIFRRIRDAFIGEDTVNVGEYIIHDVLIPAARDTIRDMIFGGVEMKLYGDRKGRRTTRDRGRSYVSYNTINEKDRDRDRDRRLNRARHDFDDIVIPTRGEAEEVLTLLVELVEDYGQASVADLLDLVGEESNFTDHKYGWTDLRNASVSRVRGGYLINLPRSQQID